MLQASTAAPDISVSPNPNIFVLPAIEVFDEMHPQQAKR